MPSVTAVSVLEKQKKLPPVYLFTAIGNEPVKTWELLTAEVSHPIFNPKLFITIIHYYSKLNIAIPPLDSSS